MEGDTRTQLQAEPETTQAIADILLSQSFKKSPSFNSLVILQQVTLGRKSLSGTFMPLTLS